MPFLIIAGMYVYAYTYTYTYMIIMVCIFSYDILLIIEGLDICIS